MPTMFGYWSRKPLMERGRQLPRAELARRSRILIIDDQEPDILQDLRDARFAVDHFADITPKNLAVLGEPLYDLVLLDFGGVGTTVGPDEGLSILKHIKRTNPATLVFAYTSKALMASHADFYRLADGVLLKDAGITDTLEKIEDGLRRAHSIENVWKGLLSVAGVVPGSATDLQWQELAGKALDKPKQLAGLKATVLAKITGPEAQRLGVTLLEKIVELGVKAVVDSGGGQ